MKINSNMSAVITNKQLLRTENKLAASMERLSTGFKINHAGDNPAGIAISNKMNAQIKALNQAGNNASDGISVLQIADGALNEVSSILQRMRELSVQAANGTNATGERETIQKEIDQLREEVDRISSDTEYNTKCLLDGSSDIKTYGKHISRTFVSDTVEPGMYQIEVETPAKKAQMEIPMENIRGCVEINGVNVEITEDMTTDEIVESIRSISEEGNCDLAFNEDQTALIITSQDAGRNAELNVSISEQIAEELGVDEETENASFDLETRTWEISTYGQDAVMHLGEGFTDTTTVLTDGNRISVTDRNGFSIEFLLDENMNPEEEESPIIDLEVTDIGYMEIQIGANQYQSMDVRIPEISSRTLYLDEVNVVSLAGATQAIAELDYSIAKVSEVRSRIGAYQNRMEYASASVAATDENMTAAYSILMDTDMAIEMAEYSQQNILNQASISVLSQANDLPQQVLSLLQ